MKPARGGSTAQETKLLFDLLGPKLAPPLPLFHTAIKIVTNPKILRNTYMSTTDDTLPFTNIAPHVWDDGFEV